MVVFLYAEMFAIFKKKKHESLSKYLHAKQENAEKTNIKNLQRNIN